MTLPTDRPDVTLEELTIDDVDAYYALVDRNRVHLTSTATTSSNTTRT